MKILVLSSGKESPETTRPADLWRIYRPMRELEKHVDWDISYQSSVIRDKFGTSDPDEFIKLYGEDEVKHLGQYDIIFTSYFTSPHEFTLLWAAQKQYGTKFIMDIDDDLYHIDEWNPIWLQTGWTGVHFMQKMVGECKYLSTTTDYMRKLLATEKNTVFTIPNYISEDYHHEAYDNGHEVVVGYFGGSSHYRDVHHTNVISGLRKVMNEHKNVKFVIMGQPLDEYLPRKRVTIIEPVSGTRFADEAFRDLKFDIALAPLLDTEFNKGKSDIKWQESTRMGAAVIASNIGPYSTLDNDVVLKVDNNTTSSWYEAITHMLLGKNRRAQLAQAQKKLETMTLEGNWNKYKEMFERVFND